MLIQTGFEFGYPLADHQGDHAGLVTAKEGGLGIPAGVHFNKDTSNP